VVLEDITEGCVVFKNMGPDFGFTIPIRKIFKIFLNFYYKKVSVSLIILIC